jgi:nucleotide-binding universal stress UspA family protein
MSGIIVGVDGSEGAKHALAWAAHEGQLHGWPVTAVMAWGWLAEHRAVVGDGFDPRFTEREAVAALDAYVTDALGPSPAVTVERRTVEDLAPRALLEASSDAHLLVVGTRGLGGFRGLLLGSVSNQCLHYAACPTAVVGRDDEIGEPAGGRVVVGIDGSEAAGRALTWAVEEARLRQASLEVVHAWQMPGASGYPLTGVSVDPSLFADAARATLDSAMHHIDETGLVKPAESILRGGRAASVILEAAKGADLVVVGSRGLGELSGPILGSVSHRVVHHASCPVVVIPAG